jgi:hypothetical protein
MSIAHHAMKQTVLCDIGPRRYLAGPEILDVDIGAEPRVVG